MIEITIYGRGGQGGVTLAKLMATAWFLRGKDAQAFGVYAAERSGAPLQAYVRIDDVAITNHNQIRQPDHVIVLDPTLIGESVIVGLKRDGWIILNTPEAPEQWKALFPGRRIACVDATAIAVRHGLGTRTVPIVNTTMMGAVARVFGLALDEVTAAFDDLRFGGANFAAAREAYDGVTTAIMSGEAVIPAAPRLAAHIPSLFDADVGAPPKIRTGSWATRRPSRRTLTPPCNHACPAGNDVQRFVAAASRAEYDEALGILLETTPLPSVCGRVCPSPCMQQCNRNAFDEGVNVRELERYAGDHGKRPEPSRTWRTPRVAVVGSGPAGLACAYQLARLGYPVDMFEGASSLGGVLRNGIPDYRLPKDVLDREIDFILDCGVTAHVNERIDANRLGQLAAKYDAVFVATGLQNAQSMLAGPRVVQGIEFLDQVHRKDVCVSGQHVVIAGGGNTAIDAARSAVRLGAASVRILYRRTRAEMPAIAEEIDAALEEGVLLDELVVPVRMESDQLICGSVMLGEPDESGRRRPIVVEGHDFVVPADRIVLALGQVADRTILTQHDNVYVGGDLGTNAGTVTAAIGSGRGTALVIHQGFVGASDRPSPGPGGPVLSRGAGEGSRIATRDDIHLHQFAHAPRQRGGTLLPDLRRRSFAEVHREIGDAQAEAARCFSCGVCNDCERCVTYCPEGVLAHRDVYRFDYDYCKGCGVCAAECPRGVIVMSEG